ncbi:guanylate-binding protein 1-like isoform X1 [Coregonus clupeaformis]|uniref:guanylate-binding protein 1-like isoform X1 n=1 Tax=Coregonus clupeaformis TaxID=59861 RepID=UPI001E1C3597|nr:guanylate-binding protein 1-like isoform X1 [Coregonus clupeaformis]
MDSPMCLVENADGELHVVPGAIKYLMGLNQQVVVVAVVGLYRTGKSYLMNKLAGKRKGFALGATIQSKTKGIWMWCVPHPEKRDHTLVLLDTEGLGDVEKGDSKNDAWIFSLAILLSSTLVYNSRGTIDNQAVENLQYVSELTERIKVNSSSAASSSHDEEEEGGDAQFVQFFPNFVWAIRDFTLLLEIDGRNVTEDGYLEHSLELRKGGGRKNLMYNLPRECIRNYFPSRKCFVFPTPTTPANMPHLDSMDEADLCGSFRKVADTFCRFIFQESRTKTVKGGHKVTGRMLGHLVNTYVETIAKGSVPCLENAVLAMAQIENQAAVDEGLAVYQRGMEEVKALFPVDMGQISSHHLRSDHQATQAFMNRSFKDGNGDFLKALAVAIAKHYADLLIQNEDASEKKCAALLEKLSAPMAQKIKEGIYATPGGYELYCNHHDNMVAQYRAEPAKGVRAEEILEQFLKEKSLEKNSILQADKKLTENEKKIHEEQEKRALAEQAVKMEAEKQHQLEKLIQERERSHQEGIRQLEAKMVQEAKEKQQELERALDSKLHEQEKLMAKGFTEKEAAMKEEIQSLREKEEAKREEKEEQSRNFRAIAQGVIESVSNGLGHYYNYRKAREERKAIVFKERVRSPPKLKSGSVGSIPDMERMTLKQDETTTPKLKMGAVGNSKDNKTLPKVNTGTTSKSPGSEF